jgi:hypothetical protein
MIIVILLFSVNATYFTQTGESLTSSLSPCGTSINGIFNEDRYLDLARVPVHVKNNRVLNYSNSNFGQIYVSNSGDDNNSGTMDDPVQNLKRAVELVNDGGTIVVLSDLNAWHETSNVSKNVTIRSENGKKTVYGHGYQIFNMDPNVKVNVTIKDLNLTDGYAMTSGGAILNNGSNLNLYDCIIDSSKTEEDGGGVFITGGGTNHIINCSFTNNEASNRGGGISITKTNTRCYISNCNFTNNNANSGGGIHLGQDNNPPIFNCSISNNTARMYGGGVYVNLGFGNFTNCNISDNSANDGGGVNINEGLSRFTTCSINSNNAEYDGGGVSIFNGTGIFTYPKIKYNIASNNGGGIKNNDRCEIYACDIFNNTANGYGGGIYNYGYETNLTLLNTTINNTFYNPMFVGNKALNGGGICNLGRFGNIHGLIVQDNIASLGSGGGVALWSSEDYTYLIDPARSGCIFINNKPENLGFIPLENAA